MYAFLHKLNKKRSQNSDRLDKYRDFFIFESFLSEDECDRIIQNSNNYKEQKTKLSVNGRAHEDETRRKGTQKNISPTSENEWIYKKIDTLVNDVNNDVYKFKLFGLTENLIVLQYGPNEHFNSWHSDFGAGKVSTRKISISLQLSNPSDYEGGVLEFFGNETFKMPKTRGALALFPSFVQHRVTPITKGQRKSLVGWYNGPPYS